MSLFADRPATADLWDTLWDGVYSEDASEREAAIDAGEKLAAAMKHPEGMLSHLMLRMGAAEQFFPAFGDRALPGNDAVLLSLWCRTEPSSYIRHSPHFSEFACTIGFADAWEALGGPD